MARKEDVLNALGEIASKFRSRLGESLTTVQEHNTPLAEATTPSLEALKAYSAGLKISASEGTGAAIPFFKRAIDLDTKFASAYAALGLMYGDGGESALAAENTSKAYQLRERASDEEKFFITAYYDGRVTGNLEKAEQTCGLWAQTYPRESLPHGFLSGFIYPASGRYEKSIDESQRVIEIDPDAVFAYASPAPYSTSRSFDNCSAALALSLAAAAFPKKASRSAAPASKTPALSRCAACSATSTALRDICLAFCKCPVYASANATWFAIRASPPGPALAKPTSRSIPGIVLRKRGCCQGERQCSAAIVE